MILIFILKSFQSLETLPENSNTLNSISFLFRNRSYYKTNTFKKEKKEEKEKKKSKLTSLAKLFVVHIFYIHIISEKCFDSFNCLPIRVRK